MYCLPHAHTKYLILRNLDKSILTSSIGRFFDLLQANMPYIDLLILIFGGCFFAVYSLVSTSSDAVCESMGELMSARWRMRCPTLCPETLFNWHPREPSLMSTEAKGTNEYSPVRDLTVFSAPEHNAVVGEVQTAPATRACVCAPVCPCPFRCLAGEMINFLYGRLPCILLWIRHYPFLRQVIFFFQSLGGSFWV